MEPLNLQKLNHLASSALINGIHIHFDSILLYKSKSYSTSYFLAILALEEIGKAFHVDHFWWHSRIDGRASPEFEHEWLKSIFDHKSKQKSYATFFDCMFDNKELMEDIYNGSIEQLKQNSIYVGIGKKRYNSNINDEINNPLKMTSVKPKEIITFTNTKLIEFCLLQIKEVGGFDSYAMAKILDLELYYRLNREWPNIDKRYKKRIKELEKFESSDDE